MARVSRAVPAELSQARRNSFELVPARDSLRADILGETEAPSNATAAEPVPPNGGYGWVIVFAVFIMNAHTWGINAVRCLPCLDPPAC
jgi:hypothetical protein